MKHEICSSQVMSESEDTLVVTADIKTNTIGNSSWIITEIQIYIPAIDQFVVYGDYFYTKAHDLINKRANEMVKSFIDMGLAEQ